jgi:hypothetical protein
MKRMAILGPNVSWVPAFGWLRTYTIPSRRGCSAEELGAAAIVGNAAVLGAALGSAWLSPPGVAVTARQEMVVEEIRFASWKPVRVDRVASARGTQIKA